MHDNLCCPASNCVFIVLIDAPPNNVCQWQKPRWFSHLWTKVPSFFPIHPFILYSMPYRCYFLSTLFHSLHYIICLIQNNVSFPQKTPFFYWNSHKRTAATPLSLFMNLFGSFYVLFSLSPLFPILFFLFPFSFFSLYCPSFPTFVPFQLLL